ncbi:hypothetical protein PHLCEN_2v10615 [Hermanssonia centrifuga]|uniref:RING-type domain-containing protein n=1 Tax=Hermanssonia centrifuga TaxID=98765 RepID=A0A2R6NNS6_9APHY|nr:hypothetical protein PHLCEN_2v10615 [Hermanssonia centrifuga]
MAPTTRSKQLNGASRRDTKPRRNVREDAAGSQEADFSDLNMIEGHLSGLKKSFRNVETEITALRQQNEILAKDLEEAQQAAEGVSQPRRGKRGGLTMPDMQKRINALRSQVAELERARKKDKRRLAKLQTREIQKDAEELQDQDEFEVGDSVDKMRKLLRRFHDLMLETPLEEGEECVICFTVMKLGSARSFPCEHVFCEDCTAQLAPGSEDVVCPHCRKVWDKRDLEVVRHTASTQWDALLEVAERWAKMDRRRETDTSEEEAEEEFIDDATDAGYERAFIWKVGLLTRAQI